ncbi:MAG: P27 family phage terminase small subunit [Bryobacteraceae bacterium]
MKKPRLPRPPKGLSDAGRKQWSAVVKTLAARGECTRFLQAVETLVRAEEALRAAEADIKARGYGVDGKRNPALATADRLRGQIAKLMRELALTPASEARLLGKRASAPANAGDRIGPNRPSRGWLTVAGRDVWVEEGLRFLLATAPRLNASSAELQANLERAVAYWEATGCPEAAAAVRTRAAHRRQDHPSLERTNNGH